MMKERGGKKGESMLTSQKVLGLIQKGESTSIISEQLHMSRKEVAWRTNNLRVGGHLPVLTEEERERRKKTAGQANGTILPQIRPYVEIGMSPAEVVEALRQEGNNEFNLKRVSESILRGRERGVFNKPNEDERLDLAKNTKKPKEQLEAEVAKWLALVKFFEATGLKDLPQGRLDWKKAIARFDEIFLNELVKLRKQADKLGKTYPIDPLKYFYEADPQITNRLALEIKERVEKTPITITLSIEKNFTQAFATNGEIKA